MESHRLKSQVLALGFVNGLKTRGFPEKSHISNARSVFHALANSIAYAASPLHSALASLNAHGKFQVKTQGKLHD